MKRILIPVDFSASTERVVRTGAKIAHAFGAEVFLLHIAPPEPEFITYEPGPPSVRSAIAKDISAQHRKLQDLERALAHEGLAVKALLIQGYIVEKILKEIERLQVDLVVMGSHGHGALYHLLLGSATEGVLRKSPVPILIVPRARGAPPISPSA